MKFFSKIHKAVLVVLVFAALLVCIIIYKYISEGAVIVENSAGGVQIEQLDSNKIIK